MPLSGLGFDGFPPKARWTELKYATTFRPKVRFDYYVTGRGGFPADMLRFDACWPVTSDDAAKLAPLGFGGPGEQRSIHMQSNQQPTIERWSSFGWAVGTEKL